MPGKRKANKSPATTDKQDSDKLVFLIATAIWKDQAVLDQILNLIPNRQEAANTSPVQPPAKKLGHRTLAVQIWNP